MSETQDTKRPDLMEEETENETLAEHIDEVTKEEEEESSLFSAPTTVTKQKPGKKRLRAFVIALCALVVLGGGVTAAYFGGLFSATEETSDVSEEDSEVHLPSLVDYSATGTTAIQKLTVKNETGSYSLVPDDTGAMVVDGYADLPRDSSEIDTLLIQYTAVTPDLVIAENPTDEQLTACGLDNPAITVTTQYEDGKSLTVCYGRLASGGEAGYYGMEQGGDTVWLFEEEYYQTVMVDYTTFLGKTLMSSPSPNSDDAVGTAKLKKLSLSGGDRTQAVTLRYISPDDDDSLQLCGKYVVEKPYLRATDSDTVSDWDTSLCGLYGATIEAVHPTDKQLASFGLSTPRAVATMTFGVYVATDEDGNDLDTPTWYNEVTYTLTLGNRTDDGAYYAMVDGVDMVYTVNSSTVPYAELEYEDFVNKSLFLRYITDLSGIRAKVGSTSYDLQLTHGTKKSEDGTSTATLTATLAGVTKDESLARGLYQEMMSVKRVSAAPADATASGEPKLMLRLVPLSGAAETTFSFYPYSANRYLCVDSDGDRFLVKAADVETVASQWNSFATVTDDEANASKKATKETSKKNNP